MYLVSKLLRSYLLFVPADSRSRTVVHGTHKLRLSRKGLPSPIVESMDWPYCDYDKGGGSIVENTLVEG